MLKKSTSLFVSIFFLLFIGLGVQSYAGHKGEPHGKGGKGGGGGGDKYTVSVTFDDLDCGTGGDHFCSDDGTPYEHGFENVTAVGDKTRLSLTLQAGTSRRFFLDFSDPCEDLPCDPVPVLDDATPDGGPKGLTSGGGSENVFSIR